MVTHSIREALLTVNFAAMLLVPAALALLASQAHRLAPVSLAAMLATIALPGAAEASESRKPRLPPTAIVSVDAAPMSHADRIVANIRALHAQADAMDAEARAMTAYFARYSAHAERAMRSGESCIGAIELRAEAARLVTSLVMGVQS